MKKKNQGESVPWLSYVSALFAVASILLWEFSIVPILAIVIGFVALVIDEKKTKAIVSIIFGTIFLVVRIAHGQMAPVISFQDSENTNNNQIQGNNVLNTQIPQPITEAVSTAFVCPEDYTDKILSQIASSKNASDYKKLHPNSTTQEYMKYLWKLFEQNDCFGSLEYMKENNYMPEDIVIPNSQFVCPEKYTDEKKRDTDMKKMIDDYSHQNPPKTVGDFFNYRYSLLLENHCYQTLANMKNNNKK